MDLSNGKYRAKAGDWALGESGNGKEQIAVEFELLDPDYSGQHITWYGYFSDGALEFTVKALRTMGWQGDDLLHLIGLDANEVVLVIENEEYQGKTYAKVKWVNAIGGLALKTPMTPAKQQSFAAQMRQRIAALDAFERQGKPATTVRAKQGGDPRDVPHPVDAGADIPF